MRLAGIFNYYVVDIANNNNPHSFPFHLLTILSFPLRGEKYGGNSNIIQIAKLHFDNDQVTSAMTIPPYVFLLSAKNTDRCHQVAILNGPVVSRDPLRIRLDKGFLMTSHVVAAVCHMKNVGSLIGRADGELIRC